MTVWQRRARLVIAIGAVAFAVIVVLAFKHRVPPQPAVGVARSDPKAIVESASGRTIRINREREEIRIDYEKLHYRADHIRYRMRLKRTHPRPRAGADPSGSLRP